ncbi:MAG TPA: hypothetical protein VID47_16910 [Actinomycetota bacterium]
MRERLRADLLVAMKRRDAVTVSALGSALAAIGNAEAVDAPAPASSGSAGSHVAGSRPGEGDQPAGGAQSARRPKNAR